LRADLRQVICDRITEMGKQTWPCFREPTAEHCAQVANTTKLEKLLIDLEEGGRREDSPIVHAQSSSDEVQEHARPHNPRAAGDDAGGSCTGTNVQGASVSCAGDVQVVGASRSATVLLDATTDEVGRTTRAGNEAAADDDDDDDEDSYSADSCADMIEQSSDDDECDSSIDSGEPLHKDSEDDDVYTHQMSRMFITAINHFRAVDDVVVDSMSQYRALERHFTSCFKFPELVGFVLVPKYRFVHKLPFTYANEQANNIFGIDPTKEFHPAYTFWGMMRSLGMMANVLLSRSESWVVHSLPKMPFNVFDENGKAVIRFQDVWGAIEMLSNDCFPVCFSPAGENELLQQPGPPKGLPAKGLPATDSPATL
jgi:hypothetical protein